MTWVRTEDAMPLHPKILRLSDGAFRLWSNALHFANRGVTDGRIPKELIASLNHHGRWSPKQLAGFVSELATGLWIDRGDHYEIHDYAHHQAEALKGRVERKRELDRARQQKKREREEDRARESLGMSRRDTACDNQRESRRETSVPARPGPISLTTFESGARAPGPFGWSDIVETFSRLRSEVWLGARGVPGGRWKAGTKDHGGISAALELFREEPDPQAALEDSIRGFLADPWCAARAWPFSVWANDPGKYRGVAQASCKKAPDGAPPPAGSLADIERRLRAARAHARDVAGTDEVKAARAAVESILIELRAANALRDAQLQREAS